MAGLSGSCFKRTGYSVQSMGDIGDKPSCFYRVVALSCSLLDMGNFIWDIFAKHICCSFLRTFPPVKVETYCLKNLQQRINLNCGLCVIWNKPQLFPELAFVYFRLESRPRQLFNSDLMQTSIMGDCWLENGNNPFLTGLVPVVILIFSVILDCMIPKNVSISSPLTLLQWNL